MNGLINRWLDASALESKVRKEAQAKTQEALKTALNAPLPLHLRKAVPEDVVEGAILWYPERYHRKWSLVAEVLYTADPWKAYTAHDGCRYGLDGAFVEVSPSKGNANG